MRMCPHCSGSGKELMTGAIAGISNVACSACKGQRFAEGMDITAIFREEGYPRSGLQQVALSFSDLDTRVTLNLTLEEVQRLRDKLEKMLQKFWSESDQNTSNRAL